MSNRWPAPLAPLVAVLCWGAMFPVAASAIDQVDSVHLNLARYGLALPIFALLLLVAEGRGAFSFEGRARRVLLLGAGGIGGFNILTYAALETVEPQDAALVVATMPMITLLTRWRMGGERPAPAILALFLLALAGVALVVTDGDPASIAHGGLEAGELLVLGGVVCWVRYTLGAAELPGWSPLRYTTLSAAGGVLAIAAAAGAADAVGLLSPPTGGDLVDTAPQLAFVVLGGAVAGVLGWNAGVRRLGPANAALFINLVPITALAIEVARGAELTAGAAAGSLLTIGALVAANLVGRRAAAAAAPPPAPVALARA